jgi:hypothetical protein
MTLLSLALVIDSSPTSYQIHTLNAPAENNLLQDFWPGTLPRVMDDPDG